MEKDIVIFDIDGTLANGEHRQHFVREKPKNWPAYMELLHLDSVHDHVKTMYELLAPKYRLYLVSGRDDTYRRPTQEWLVRNGFIFHEALYMRKAKDYRSDDIIKREIFDAHFADVRDRILCVFDDRPRVIRMWRALGLKVFDCGEGIEF